MTRTDHPTQNEREWLYIDRTLIEDDRDTIGRVGNTIHVKNNNIVILDILTNSLRNAIAHHFTPTHTITSSYR